MRCRWVKMTMGPALLAMTLVGMAHAADAPTHPSPPKPEGRPGDWASDDDYPVRALRDNAEGIVGFALTVGVDGAPTRCEIKTSSGNADLDAATCNVMMQRAHFTPATDAAGKATIGTYANTMRWQLPDDGKYSVPLPGEVRFEYDVAADGTVSNCKLVSSGEVADFLAKDEEESRCRQAGPFSNQTDKAGKPVKRHIVVTQTNVVTNIP